MTTEKFVFFYGGTFSQWCPSKSVIDGVEYSCCEQYMIAKKALMFHDIDAYKEIMATKDPSRQKALGRMVHNFNKEHWERYCHKIVYDANYAKFTQNDEMFEVLKQTEDKEIVEASPTDRIWGIGLDEKNPLAWNKSTWRGCNWLGEAIMSVREELIPSSKRFIVNGLVIPRYYYNKPDWPEQLSFSPEDVKEWEKRVEKFCKNYGIERQKQQVNISY